MANLTLVHFYDPWFVIVFCVYTWYTDDWQFCSYSEDQPSANSISAAAASELNGDDDPTKSEEMGGLRNRLMCRFVSSTCFQMNRRKTLGEDLMETPLRRCLSTLDITMLGNISID